MSRLVAYIVTELWEFSPELVIALIVFFIISAVTYSPNKEIET